MLYKHFINAFFGKLVNVLYFIASPKSSSTLVTIFILEVILDPLTFSKFISLPFTKFFVSKLTVNGFTFDVSVK